MSSAPTSSEAPLAKILYVDDDVIAGRMFAHEMGKKRGYDVDVVSTVQAALNYAFAQTYDIIVSDLVMPGMDGIALIATLQEVAPDTVFVIVSGLPETQVHRECNEGAADVDSVLCKPWRPDDMDSIVRAALRHRGGDDSQALGTVLVVDPDLGDAVLTQCYLEDLGYRPDQVRHCTSVKAAIDVINQENIDVVVSDVRLPGGDPDGTVAALRAAAPDAALVVLTDSADADVELKAVKDGAHNVLRKTAENYTDLGKNLRGATMRLVSERRLVVASHEDALTGIANRRALETRTRQAMARARRSGQKVGIVVLDVNNLEFVHCMIGAHAGDQLLVQVAAQIRMTIREEDEVGRLEGGRFVVLLEQLDDATGAWACVDRLKEALEPQITVSGIPVDLPVNVGIAMHPDDGANLEELLAVAIPPESLADVPWTLKGELGELFKATVPDAVTPRRPRV